MTSLQARLSLGLLASLVVLFVLQWLAVSLALRTLTEQQVASRLQADAEDLLAALTVGGGRLHLDTTRASPASLRPFSGHYYVILTPAEPIASRSLWDMRLDVEPLAAGMTSLTRMPGPERQRLLVRAAGYSKFERPITIAVAQDLSAFDQSLRRFQIGHGLISSVALIVLVLAQRTILQRSLQPLQSVRNDVQRLERGEIEHVSVRVPTEIAPLVTELNRLLLASRSRGRRSREALGNLAHALKTQLAVLTQVAEDPRLRGNAELSAQLREPLERIQALTARELKRARLAGGALPGQKVDIGLELERLANALRLIYPDKPLEIEVLAPESAQFKGDAEDFLELMGNLMDNAAKFSGERVRITVESQNGLRLCVEDDGPGCTEELFPALTARGVRADESVAGAGLGLAIARDIADSYNAELRLARSPTLGGFLAEVRFP